MCAHVWSGIMRVLSEHNVQAISSASLLKKKILIKQKVRRSTTQTAGKYTICPGMMKRPWCGWVCDPHQTQPNIKTKTDLWSSSSPSPCSNPSTPQIHISGTPSECWTMWLRMRRSSHAPPSPPVSRLSWLRGKANRVWIKWMFMEQIARIFFLSLC